MTWPYRLSAVLLALSALSSCNAPRDVSVSIDAPVSVSEGREFVFTCVVANKAAKSQKLLSLDVADEFLKGIVVRSTEPAFTEAMHLPILNVMSYSFDRTLTPGESLKVVFRCYAAKAGDWSGEVTFYINSNTSALTQPLRTIVE
jgi:hypothetical protein